MTTEGVVGIDGGEVEMAEVTWNTKKKKEKLCFFMIFSLMRLGGEGGEKEMYRCLRLILQLKNSMNSY